MHVMNRSVYLVLGLSLQFATVVEGQFRPDQYGIGATLIRADSTAAVVVESLTPDGPADLAGLIPGDRIVQLDTLSLRDLPFNEIIDYITSDEPLPLRITVLRDSNRIGFQLVRARFSDIASGAGLRWIGVGSGQWMLVPLEERAAVGIGSYLYPAGLSDTLCNDSEFIWTGNGEALLYFWAEWCDPCKLLIMEMRKASDRIAASGIRLVGINVDNSCETFLEANENLHPPGEQYWAGGYHGDLPQSLRVYRRGIPAGALVDKDGSLLGMSLGVSDVMRLLTSD